MANAFKATFCHYKDPTQKIEKIFETGNTKSRNWRTYKCPNGQFASKMAVGLNYFNSYDIGFVALKMECQNL